MDGYLKKQNMTKKERNHSIEAFLMLPAYKRDEYLEMERERIQIKPKETSEEEEQIRFVYEFRKKYPALIFMVRNDGTRTPREKAQQKTMGLVAGVSDLICLEYKMAIEMKRVKYGLQSDAQYHFAEYCRGIGWHYILAAGCDDGLVKVKNILKLTCN